MHSKNVLQNVREELIKGEKENCIFDNDSKFLKKAGINEGNTNTPNLWRLTFHSSVNSCDVHSKEFPSDLYRIYTYPPPYLALENIWRNVEAVKIHLEMENHVIL